MQNKAIFCYSKHEIQLFKVLLSWKVVKFDTKMYSNFSNFRGWTSAGGGTSLGPKTGTSVGWGGLAKFSPDGGDPPRKKNPVSRTLSLTACLNLHFPPGGPLVSEVGYHPRKKIHVIRVVFQDKAMYARTSFRGAKTCKIGKKGMFLVILTNFWMNMTLKLRKTLAKTRI